MKRYILLALFGSLLFSDFVYAQTLSISGQVLSQEDKKPLPGATIRLHVNKDSTAFYTTSNEEGLFKFNNLKAGGYNLNISYIGYETFNKIINLSEDIVLANLHMVESADYLKEVEITEKIPRAVQKGDTTEFNSLAYKTRPDASTEDLIKKMPGVVISDGTVQVQGEDVKEVLVDGRRFFGNDPSAALKNLPAEIVDKIQVFDKQSDQAQLSGFDDGESSKTINIITRQDKRNGEFGKLYAGYGFDNRYALGGNINVFNGDQRFSLIGQSNNINIQNFATEDLLGVVGSGGGRSRGGGPGGRGGGGGRSGGPGGGPGGGSTSNFMVGQQSGINQTNAIGFNYIDNWGDKIEVSGSYFFNNSNNSADQSSSRETFLSEDSSQFYNENSISESDNFNHRFNMRMVYSIDDKNSIIFQPSMSWQKNVGREYTEAQTLLNDASLLNQTINESTSDLSGINFNNSLMYRRRFDKQGRSLSLRINSVMNGQEGENTLLAENTYYSDATGSIDTLDQYSTLDSYTRTYSANVTYTEPLGDKFSLMLNYEASLKNGDSEKYTYQFDESSDTFSLLDSTLTNTFASQYVTQEAGTGLRFNQGNFSLMSSLNYQYATLSNEQYFPYDADLNRSFQNLLPSAMLHYRFEDGKNIRLFYRTSTSAPDVSDLQNVIDNSNPLMLSQGNPELEQSYDHNLFGRFAAANADKASSFFVMLGGSYTNNYIGQSTFTAEEDTVLDGRIVLAQGAQLNSAVNLDHSWSLRSFMSYGIPLSSIKSNLNFNTSVNLSQTPGLVNNQLNHSNNLGLGLGLVLSSNISELIDFTLSSRSNYNWVNNSLQSQLNNNYFNQNTNLQFHIRTDKGLFIEADANHQFYAGLSDNYNQNYILMNVGVGKKILKNQLGEIKLTVFDLFNQNNSISRTVTETYIEDTQTEVLQRFAMLTFTYNLRNFHM